jgi:hypothetical protein
MKTVKFQWGMSCPACGADDALDIAIVVRARLTEEGTDTDLARDTDHDWGDKSQVDCACAWFGLVEDCKR